MRVIILAGGRGTRLSEETDVRPKPMVEIGGKPILWHIMKIYSHYGFNDFVICLGYLGHVIKEYFVNYQTHMGDLTVDMRGQTIITHRRPAEAWRVTLVDTGLEAGTAERILAVESHLGETFMVTYGDGVADIDIAALASFHAKHDKLVTMSIAQPKAKLGAVGLGPGGAVWSFREKPPIDGWINCGFFVMNRAVLQWFAGNEYLEGPLLTQLVEQREVMAYPHTGYWQCMDTLREKNQLQALWDEHRAPWKVW